MDGSGFFAGAVFGTGRGAAEFHFVPHLRAFGISCEKAIPNDIL